MGVTSFMNEKLEDMQQSLVDYGEYIAYRNRILPYDDFTWGPDNWDYGRLPANISIFDFLIYQGKLFASWLTSIGYTGEEILFVPAYPDIILSQNASTPVSADSPHSKIPYTIAYEITRHEPDSKGTGPFNGSSKDWKLNDLGIFKDPESGLLYNLRMRQWESLVTYTVISRSGVEVEWLTKLFEDFCDMQEGAFLEAGVEKTVTCGRLKQDDVALANAGVVYRKTLRWYRTEEFKIYGPIVERIGSIELDVNNPTTYSVASSTAPTLLTPPVRQQATMVRVLNGDTYVVRIDGMETTMRLIGLTCPSMDVTDAQQQAKLWRVSADDVMTRGTTVTTYIASLFPAESVITYETDTTIRDMQNRLLAYVWIDDVNMLNDALLSQGYAWYTPSVSNVRYNARFFAEAKLK